MEYHARRRHGYLYYTAWSLLLLAAFVLQSGGVFPALAGVRPLPVLALVCAFSIFNGVAPGFAFGLAAGVLMDLTSGSPDGFHAIAMSLVGLVLALLSEYLFNQRLLTAGILSFAACGLYELALFLFAELPKGYEGVSGYLGKVTLPSLLYTWVFVLPFYFLARYLRNASQRERGHKGTGGAWR